MDSFLCHNMHAWRESSYWPKSVSLRHDRGYGAHTQLVGNGLFWLTHYITLQNKRYALQTKYISCMFFFYFLYCCVRLLTVLQGQNQGRNCETYTKCRPVSVQLNIYMEGLNWIQPHYLGVLIHQWEVQGPSMLVRRFSFYTYFKNTISVVLMPIFHFF